MRDSEELVGLGVGIRRRGRCRGRRERKSGEQDSNSVCV